MRKRLESVEILFNKSCFDLFKKSSKKALTGGLLTDTSEKLFEKTC